MFMNMKSAIGNRFHLLFIYTVSSGYALGRQTAGVKLYYRQQSYLSNFL